MKNVIVTGGCGFIGSNLVDYLIKKKYFVINIDKLTYSANRLSSNIRNNRNYKLIKIDINNSKKITKIIQKFKPKVVSIGLPPVIFWIAENPLIGDFDSF